MPVKLTLPTFDPARPLEFTAMARVAGMDAPVVEQLAVITLRMVPRDGFVKEVLIDLWATIPGGASQLHDLECYGGVLIPASAGLCGDEGWFAVEGGKSAFIWDLMVSYTPRDLGNASASRAFFS